MGAVFASNSTNITVTWNRYRNIGDGTVGSGHSNFVQFGSVTGGYIAHNKGLGGNTEDIISMFKSQGASASSPIVIEPNAFQGLNWSSVSGTGINLGDHGGSHIVARFNTLLSPGQVGISVGGGTDMRVTDNIIYGAIRPLSNFSVGVWNQSPTVCSASGCPVTRSGTATTATRNRTGTLATVAGSWAGTAPTRTTGTHLWIPQRSG